MYYAVAPARTSGWQTRGVNRPGRDPLEAGQAAGRAVFCSWSGGKDCALALHEVVRAGAVPRALVTMLTEDGIRSRSHGLHRRVLAAQASAMGMEIRFGSASWAGYEAAFDELARAAVADGMRTGIFGDIDTAAHRAWVDALCARAGAQARLPLWQRARREVMQRLLDAGFAARIVAVRAGRLSPELLGATIDRAVLDELAAAGVDLAGENGEYHTVVVDGPLFERRLELTLGERVLRDGVWFADLLPSPG